MTSVLVGQSRAQIAALSTSAIAKLGAADIAALTPDQASALSGAQLNAVSAPAISAFSRSAVSALTAGAIAGLAPSGFSKFTAAQVSAMTTAQISALSTSEVAGMTRDEVSGLTAAQVHVMSTSQLAAITTSSISGMTATAGAALAPAQIQAFSGAQLGAMAAATLKTLAVSSLTATQVGGLGAAGVANLSTTQTAGLSTDQIHALTTTEIAALTTAQASSLGAAQTGALSQTQTQALSGAQLSALTMSALQAVNVANLKTTQLTGLSAAATANLSNAQVGALSTTQLGALGATQIQGLTATQLNSLSATSLNALDLTKLTNAQVGGLSTAALGSLTSSKFTAAIAPRIASLSTTQLAGLSTAQLGSVTAAQAATLGASQVAALSSAQRSALFSTNPLEQEITKAEQAGPIGFSAMKQIMQDAAVGGMNGAKFSILQDLAKAVDAGTVQTDAYTRSLTDDVVEGSAFNQYYTGGGTTHTALGNLSATSTQTQAQELVGKWFLGNDNPNLVSPDAPIPATYKATTLPLFSASGPSATDVNQGNIGDCYFVTSLAETAAQNPNAIRNMIHDNGDGTYGVRFYDTSGKAAYVTVDNKLPTANSALWTDGSNLEYANGSSAWVGIVEKAYAEFASRSSSPNSYAGIQGGVPGYAMETLNGTQPSFASVQKGMSQSQQTALLTQLQQAFASGNAMSMDTSGSVSAPNLVSSHAFEVTGVNASDGTISLRNPWNKAGLSSGKAMEFTMRLSDLVADGVADFEYAPTTARAFA